LAGYTATGKAGLYFGTRSSIDVSLQRVLAKDTIRRVIRGRYDDGPYGGRLKRALNSDAGQLARALAWKFDWQIQLTGMAALNAFRMRPPSCGSGCRPIFAAR